MRDGRLTAGHMMMVHTIITILALFALSTDAVHTAQPPLPPPPNAQVQQSDHRSHHRNGSRNHHRHRY
jgi:hypothetical protein